MKALSIGATIDFRGGGKRPFQVNNQELVGVTIMDETFEGERLSWITAGVGLALELLIGLGGWAVGWMLLRDELGRNINLLVEFFAVLEIIPVLWSAAAGAAVAVVLWLMVRFVKPLQRSRSLRVLSILSRATWLQLVLLCLVAGVAEEMLFRGALQPRVGIWPAAVLFGLLHAYGRLYVVVAILAGVGLGYLYDFTGSLAAVAVAHAVYNLTISVLVKLGLFPMVHEERPETAPDISVEESL